MTVSQFPEDKSSQPDVTESTPLLKDASTRHQPYTGKAGETTSTADATSSSPDEDAAYLGLGSVTVAQAPEVDTSLERVLSAASANKYLPHDSEAGGPRTEPKSDYAARFLHVTPTRFWLIFGGVLFGYIIGFFDATLMASSHPVITSHFHASNSASWLSTAFLLTSTAFMPLFGRVSDTFGRRPVYLFSVVVFFVTTAWCGMAQSIGSFIAARAFCGLGAGGVFSMGMILSSDLVRIEYRGIYQSYINLCLGVGGCLGIAFGGYLCDQVGWRGAFFVQLPFIFLYFLIAAFTTPAELGLQTQVELGLQTQVHDRKTFSQLIKSIDLVGSALLIIAVTALIMGLNLGGNVFRWSHPLVISSLVLSFVLGLVFILYERRVERAAMPTYLLSQNPRAGLIFGNFFANMAWNTVIFNAPLYFQAVKLASATESGLNLVSTTLASTISSVATGFLVTWSRRLKPTIVLGCILLILGGLAATTVGAHTPDIVAMICVSVTSLGLGFSNPSVTVAILATSDQDEQAVATTTMGLFRNLGSVMGVSASSWIFQNTLRYQLEEKVTEPDRDIVIQLVRKSVHAIANLDPLHRSQVIDSYAVALRLTFFSSAIWAAIMFVLHVGVRLPRLGEKA